MTATERSDRRICIQSPSHLHCRSPIPVFSSHATNYLSKVGILCHSIAEPTSRPAIAARPATDTTTRYRHNNETNKQPRN